MSNKARREHARVVDNEQIAGTQKIGQPREGCVFDSTGLS
jgi:hypothetical protein